MPVEFFDNRDKNYPSIEEMSCPKCDSVTAHELRDNVTTDEGGELWTCILCKTQLH